ncbi:hypothetical protein pipiens_010037 [Culex pipiens pipiens]|uniref:Uncharacterized protein n=1 Tax=Culex pipiens pipiens TaxID=38569 RepID=A0ABD1DBW8_CULPP
MSKAPKINSPPRKTWLSAHGSTTTLASQLSDASSRSSLGGLSAPKFARSATSQRLRPWTIDNLPADAGKLHKLGSVPAYLRRNRPATSPADAAKSKQLVQLDSGVGSEPLDSGVEVAAGPPEGSAVEELKLEPALVEAKKEAFVEPKAVPAKRPRVSGPARDPVKLEQCEAFQKLASCVQELKSELAQRNVEYASLVQSNAALTQENSAMACRVEALEKLVKPPQVEAVTENVEVRNFRDAMQANVRKQDEALVGLRDMLLNSMGRERPAKLDESVLRALVKQMQESSLEMRQLVKNNRQLSEEFVNPDDLAQAEASMRNLLDVGLGEIVTGRIVYD